MGRVLDVFGRTIDDAGSLEDVRRESIHQTSPAIDRRTTKSEVFETGIKAIDLLSPLERGGKAGLFGGAGVGKTVLINFTCPPLIASLVGFIVGRIALVRCLGHSSTADSTLEKTI